MAKRNIRKKIKKNKIKNGCIIGQWETKLWYVNNKLHRDDGPAIEYTNGDKKWYQNGYLHREDGPAVEHSNGNKIWYQNGKFHRKDGPAIEYADGTKSWYYHNKRINCRSQKEFEKIIKLRLFW